MRVILLGISWLIPSILAAQSTSERWDLVAELRMGAVTGPQALTYPHALLASHDGRYIYVGQQQESLIRMFDASSGKLMRTIGREGAGPGEFGRLAQLSWKQDTLAAVDLSQQRASLFSPDGKHIRTTRIASAPLRATGSPATLRWFLANGTAIGASMIAMDNVSARSISASPWVQMAADGKILRTVALVDVRNAFGKIQAGGRQILFPRPMSEETLLQVAPDGSSFVIVDARQNEGTAGRFLVTRIGAEGDTLYQRAYRYTPREIPPPVLDNIYKEFGSRLPQVPGGLAMKAVREQLDLPRFQPPVSQVVVGSDGSAWLRREVLDPKRVDWLVLGPDGRIRATVRTPPGVKILAINRGVAWGVVKDSLDVPFVVRYRIVRNPRS